MFFFPPFTDVCSAINEEGMCRIFAVVGRQDALMKTW